jgi:hypothetical protein
MTKVLSIYLSIYSCCPRLEHMASVKRFVSLQFLNLRQYIEHLGRGITPTQGRYLHSTTQTQNKRRQILLLFISTSNGFLPGSTGTTIIHNTHIHALSGIRTHDPIVRAGEDISSLRPSGHCDRQRPRLHYLKIIVFSISYIIMKHGFSITAEMSAKGIQKQHRGKYLNLRVRNVARREKQKWFVRKIFWLSRRLGVRDYMTGLAFVPPLFHLALKWTVIIEIHWNV